ncbi:hypothetical protein BDQ17DRAFT_1366414 [Cyathus striatus]|nr:hypothetical protein BDQ17DRAFT_1366414 [Cyathus striatus]
MTDMKSSLQQHLGTNYIPSIFEARQIQDFLDISSEEVHDIDVEINKLQQQLELLQVKRLKISDLAEQHRALLSPVRRLSRDILGEIFLACLPTDRNPCMSATEAPMLLTRINSSWRNIAHLTPRLWAAIHITFPSVDTRIYPNTARSYLTVREAQLHLKLTQREAGIREWLERAGTYPLSISIYQSVKWGQCMPGYLPVADPYGNRVDKYQELYLSFIRNTIVPYHKRWYDIDMYVNPSTLNGLLASGPDGLTAKHMPMLKSVHIGVNATVNQYTKLVKWKEIVGLLSSQVITATISGIGVSSLDFYLTPKHVWGQLTELNLKLHPVEFTPVNLCGVSSSVICHCLALKILKLIVVPLPVLVNAGGSSDINTWPQTMVDISLPHLIMLSLSLPSTTDTVEFVKRLHLPSIQQLDFELSGYEQTFTGIRAEDILKMVLRASGGGVSLGLYWPYWISSSAQMLHILQNIPYLTSLVIASTSIKHDKWSIPYQPSQFYSVLNDGLLSALSPVGKEYSEIICPQLEVLECDSNLVTEITEQGLRDFVQARRQANLRDQRVVPLRKLCISINDYKQDVPVDEEVSLGEDSAVYFRKYEDYSLSPWMGLEVQTHKRLQTACSALDKVIYTKL